MKTRPLRPLEAVRAFGVMLGGSITLAAASAASTASVARALGSMRRPSHPLAQVPAVEPLDHHRRRRHARHSNRDSHGPPHGSETATRRHTEDTLARVGVIDGAKRPGLTLYDIRVLLDAGDAGEPAYQQLQDLARRKLPEVEELIARAERVPGWL